MIEIKPRHWTCLIVFFLVGCFEKDQPLDFIELQSGPFRAAYLIPDPDASFTKMEIVLQAGEVDNDGPEGLAHYVEHLAWLSGLETGSKLPRHSNAWTNLFATGYFVRGRKTDLKANLERLMKAFEPFTRTRQFMIEEIGIVEREFDLRTVEQPSFEIYEDMQEALHRDTALSRSVIGSKASIGSFTLEQAQAFHERTHLAANAVLLVHGPVKASDLEPLIAALPAQDSLPLEPLPDIDDTPGKVHLEWTRDDIAGEELWYRKLVATGQALSDPQLDATTTVLRIALDSTMPGGIAGPLRFDNFIARSFDFSLYRYGDAHIEVNFTAEPDTGIELPDLLAAFEAALDGGSLPQETFENAKKRELDGLRNLNRPALETYGLVKSQIIDRRPPFGVNDLIEATEALKLEDVNALYRAISSPGRVVTGFVLND